MLNEMSSIQINAKPILIFFINIFGLGGAKIVYFSINDVLSKSQLTERNSELAGALTGDKSITIDTLFEDLMISKLPKSTFSINTFLLAATVSGAYI